MNESNPLMEYALEVARMRDLQRLITPGTPARVRMLAREAEQLVDAMTTAALLPPIPLPFREEQS